MSPASSLYWYFSYQSKTALWSNARLDPTVSFVRASYVRERRGVDRGFFLELVRLGFADVAVPARRRIALKYVYNGREYKCDVEGFGCGNVVMECEDAIDCILLE
jgi:hypothetical protein